MSKVEITATDAAGKVFIGLADIQWLAANKGDVALKFKPHSIHQFRVLEDDGSVIGLQRDFVKPD